MASFMTTPRPISECEGFGLKPQLEDAINARLTQLRDRYFPTHDTTKLHAHFLRYTDGGVVVDLNKFPQAGHSPNAPLMSFIVGAGLGKYGDELSRAPEISGARVSFGSLEDLQLCLKAVPARWCAHAEQKTTPPQTPAR